MPATYECHWDTAGNRLEIKVSGVFDATTFAQWDRIYRAAMLKAPHPGWTIIGDLTQCPAQNDAVAKGVEALMTFGFAHGCANAVYIVPKAVSAMQAKRMAKGAQTESKTAFVATRQEALDWLGATTILQ
jgi:hypothetical protein